MLCKVRPLGAGLEAWYMLFEGGKGQHLKRTTESCLPDCGVVAVA